MKIATLATLVAFTAAEFHEARICAQQLKLKLGEKVTFDTACLNPITAGLGCVADAPGCRYCEFNQFAAVPCVPGNTYPPIRTYTGVGAEVQFQGAQTQFPALAQALSQRYPGLAQALAKGRQGLMENVMDMSESNLLTKYNEYVQTFENIPTHQAKPLEFDGWKQQMLQRMRATPLRTALTKQGNPIRAALIERVSRKQPVRQALLQGVKNVAESVFQEQYKEYVKGFENIPTHQAKPLLFDEWKAQKVQQIQMSPVVGMLQSRLGMNNEDDHVAYQSYVKGFENIPAEQAKPDTFAVWKQKLTTRMPLMDMDESSQYAAYVKGFENIPTEQANPLTFPEWQKHHATHRRLTGYYGDYGYGGIGGYGRGFYGRGYRRGYGIGGYGRRYGRRFWG